MPEPRRDPAGLPDASVIWHFRVATLGTHAVLCATLGLGFGALAERWLAQAHAPPQQVRIEHPALPRARLGS